MVFNPFKKDFKEVNENDLEKLKEVNEGWFVEYKSERANPKNTSRSISSFANSHGGLYFVGIEEDETNNCAKEVKGVDDNPDYIRDSLRGNLEPFPFIEVFPIKLSNKKHVIMVVVPEGENPPYVLNDGRIYRRQESASDSLTHETNRNAIDDLYNKNKEYKEKLKKFRMSELSFSFAESNSPYLEVFVNTSPFNHHTIKDFFSKENLRKLKELFNGDFDIRENIKETGNGQVFITGNMSIDTISTYHRSISLRSLKDADLAYNGRTIEIDMSGNLKIMVPLEQKYVMRGSVSEDFLKILSNSRMYSSVFIIDYKQLQIVIPLLKKYAEYLGSTGYSEDIELVMNLNNCDRKALYIGGNSFFEHIKEYGVPICMKPEQTIPSKPLKFKIHEINTKPIGPLLAVVLMLMQALGCQWDISIKAIRECSSRKS